MFTVPLNPLAGMKATRSSSLALMEVLLEVIRVPLLELER